MRLALLSALCLGMLVAGRAAADQASVTAADLARLEDSAADIRTRVTALRASDPTLAGDVERSLGDLTDEIAYLRVKLRREGSVAREEYTSLRDRLETLRVRSQGQAAPAASPAPAQTPGAGVVPVGTEFDVRLQASINSGTAKVEQRFEATTLLDYAPDGVVLIPAGSTVRGYVSAVRAAGKVERRGSLTLSFDEVRIRNRSYRLRASVVQAIDAKAGEDVKRIGAGAVVGAILGGIIGGGKGVLVGVLVGAGGTMAATEGTDVNLPAGTILRLRFDEPLEVAGAS